MSVDEPVPAIDGGRKSAMVTKLLVSIGNRARTLGLCGLSAYVASAAPDTQPTPTTPLGNATATAKCSEWNTRSYFYLRNLEDVEVCLAAGYSPAVRDEHGKTPLHHAAMGNESPTLIRALIKAGGDPNARDQSGASPLHGAAAHNENAAVVRALLSAGADPQQPDDSGTTPLHKAGMNENTAILRALLDTGADPMAVADDGWFPIHWAASNEAADGVKALVGAGADPKTKTRKDEIPLHFARYAQTAHVLIVFGNDTNARDFRGQTPLHFAAENGAEPELIDLLVGSGARVHARNAWGQTPMHRFAWRLAAPAGEWSLRIPPHEPILDALIANGAEINAQDQFGGTPLHHAARFSRSGPVIRALLDAGADGTVLNAEGQTPWDEGRDNDDLRKHDGDAYWRLNEARLARPTSN